MADLHKNFAYSTVATAPSPASSGTSLVVATGDGTNFPTVPFNATVWPTGSQPTNANAEIVRVTAISTDTFTITRTQEGTSARSIQAGDQIAAAITAKTLQDVETLWQAPNHNLITWSYGPEEVQTGTKLSVAGTVYFSRLHVPKAQNITNILLFITVAGSGLTAGQSFAGLYQNGSLIGATADQSTAWATSGMQTMALSGGPFAVSAGDVYVAFFSNGTTLPTFGRNGSQSGFMANVGLTTPNLRWGTADTARTTTFPATMGTQSVTSDTYWAALS